MTAPDGTGHKQSIKPTGRMDRGQARSILVRLTREWSHVMRRVDQEDRRMVLDAATELLGEIMRGIR